MLIINNQHKSQALFAEIFTQIKGNEFPLKGVVVACVKVEIYYRKNMRKMKVILQTTLLMIHRSAFAR